MGFDFKNFIPGYSAYKGFEALFQGKGLGAAFLANTGLAGNKNRRDREYQQALSQVKRPGSGIDNSTLKEARVEKALDQARGQDQEDEPLDKETLDLLQKAPRNRNELQSPFRKLLAGGETNKALSGLKGY